MKSVILAGVLAHESGEVLLRRLPNKKYTFTQGYWLPGEMPQAAARRAIDQQAGFAVKLTEHLGRLSRDIHVDGVKTNHRTELFLGRIIAVTEFPAERSVEWVPVDQAQHLFNYAADELIFRGAMPLITANQEINPNPEALVA